VIKHAHRDRLANEGLMRLENNSVHELNQEQLAMARQVGRVVFQFFQLLPTLTVAENVMHP